jgi:phospholipase C
MARRAQPNRSFPKAALLVLLAVGVIAAVTVLVAFPRGSAPTVTSFSPLTGGAGTTITIHGSGFAEATSVMFGGTAARYTRTSDGEITAVVPGGARSGPIEVGSSDGSGASDHSFSVIPIRHVVIIDLENHTFDSVLGLYCVDQKKGLIHRAGSNSACDGVTTGKLLGGKSFPLMSAPDYGYNIGHSVGEQIRAIDHGKMDGFTTVRGCTANSGHPYDCLATFDPLGGPCGIHENESCIPNLVTLADRFAISDRTFEFATSASWAGHMVFASATQDGFYGDNPHISQVPGVSPGVGWGCDGHTDAKWWDGHHVILEPSCVPSAKGRGPYRPSNVKSVPTIFQTLDRAHLPWKIYGGLGEKLKGPGYIWAICPTFWSCLGSKERNNLVAANDVMTAAHAGQLPAVSIVTPVQRNSEHPPKSMSMGDNWLGRVLTSLMTGPEWNSTAVFLTWDDCGCFYDHVNPLQYNPTWGLRVPMFIISPWAKPGFTDSNPATFVSTLAFIEHIFGLSPLHPCAKAPSPHCTDDANSYDYMKAFDFSQHPLGPAKMVTIPFTRQQLAIINTFYITLKGEA